MLEDVEAISAVAWDVASVAAQDGQGDYAADVAGTVALDGAVRVAQNCIQVLGGIGFTFEHSAHLYLRRAVGLRSWLDGSDRYALRLARRAVAGERRELAIDLGGEDRPIRAELRATAADIAARPEGERLAALVEPGFLAPHWPKPYGRSAGPVEQIVIDEELAAAGVERPDIKIAGWALPTILEHGTDAQRERFVLPSMLGEVVWCQLFSEPGAGSDLASLTTKAERVEGGWKLTGQKVWTSMADEADWGVCLARTNPDEKRHRGISYFLVDMTSAGIDIRPLREATGEALFNEVFLDGVFVPDDCLVGEVDDGWRLARTTLANERVAMASTRLGASVERAVELVAADAEPTDLARVGRAVALSTACSLLGARTALNSIAGQGPGAASSVAKLLGVKNRQDASELVVDLLGDRALLADPDVRADVHEMLMTRCLSIAGGTTQILRNVAAEMLLGLPR
jgi:alkylation response protein AidB-like acyl-CoA dehydrogenase